MSTAGTVPPWGQCARTRHPWTDLAGFSIPSSLPLKPCFYSLQIQSPREKGLIVQQVPTVTLAEERGGDSSHPSSSMVGGGGLTFLGSPPTVGEFLLPGLSWPLGPSTGSAHQAVPERSRSLCPV